MDQHSYLFLLLFNAFFSALFPFYKISFLLCINFHLLHLSASVCFFFLYIIWMVMLPSLNYTKDIQKVTFITSTKPHESTFSCSFSICETSEAIMWANPIFMSAKFGSSNSYFYATILKAPYFALLVSLQIPVLGRYRV